MNFVTHGLSHGPILVCLPGLIGGPEDFRDIIVGLRDHFRILIVDPNAERREQEGLNLSTATMLEISFDTTAVTLRDELLRSYRDQRYFFLGVSLGGKVVYDFALRFPELFAGGVITDVGLSPFGDSELFKVIEGIVDHTDLNLPWTEIKRSLQDLIPDKNLRILIQTQIAYPEKKPPAVWKTGMKNFEALLKRQTLDDQVDRYAAVDGTLTAAGKRIVVLHAEKMSGISTPGHQVLKGMKSIQLVEVPGSTHLLHVTHKDEIADHVIALKSK